MKVCHVISSIDKNSGGTTEYLRLLANELSFKCKNSVVALASYESIKFIKDVEVKLVPKLSEYFSYSKELIRILSNEDCQIFHGNGLWQYPVHSMAKAARKRKIPYITSTHGMLEPWSLQQGKLIKQLALKLFQYRDLRKASCLHATSLMEVENLRKLGFKNPIALIPNGVDINNFPDSIPEKLINKRKILFLSRIHVKKGIEILIDSYKLLPDDIKQDWIIEIVGNGDPKYISLLNKKIMKENLSHQVTIKSPVFGLEKIKLFREANLFVLPTYSENFGIVIAEALASFTPVITTREAPWQDLDNFKCGWWIENNVPSLFKALSDACLSNDEKLLEMGKNGRLLIEKKYSIDSVAKQMSLLYDWLLYKKNKPNFISELKN